MIRNLGGARNGTLVGVLDLDKKHWPVEPRETVQCGAPQVGGVDCRDEEIERVPGKPDILGTI